MKQLEDIIFLKKLALESEKKAASTRDIYYQNAYKQIAAGSALLWRLLDQDRGNEDNGKAVLAGN